VNPLEQNCPVCRHRDFIFVALSFLFAEVGLRVWRQGLAFQPDLRPNIDYNIDCNVESHETDENLNGRSDTVPEIPASVETSEGRHLKLRLGEPAE
jgi:hypothetical protein